MLPVNTLPGSTLPGTTLPGNMLAGSSSFERNCHTYACCRRWRVLHPRASQRRLDGAIDRGGSLSRGRVVIEDDSLLVGDNHSEVAVVPHLQHRFPHQSRDGMRPPQKPIDYHDHMHREIARLPGGALHGSLYHWNSLSILLLLGAGMWRKTHGVTLSVVQFSASILINLNGIQSVGGSSRRPVAPWTRGNSNQPSEPPSSRKSKRVVRIFLKRFCQGDESHSEILFRVSQSCHATCFLLMGTCKNVLSYSSV